VKLFGLPGGLVVPFKRLLVYALAALVLVGTAVACWDAMDAQKTVVYDQIYAQSRVQNVHSSYIAKVIARKYGRKLADAFKTEPACDGLNFSVRANKGLRGKPGRWNLEVDMVTSEQPDEVVSVQPWSLVLPNRDGTNSLDTQIVSDKGEPAMIMREVCSTVKNSGV
jgi:hypothetical protein